MGNKMKFGSKAFFSYYEAAHQNSNNRYIHHLGHSLAIVAIFVFLAMPLVSITLIAIAFGLSWLGHYLFEQNTPAFFETSELVGWRAKTAHHLKISLGGLLWTIACFFKHLGLGPLAK